MEPGTIAQWAAVGVAIALALLGLLRDNKKGWSDRINEVAKTNSDLAKIVQEIASRLTVIEHDLEHMPSKDAMHRMQLDIAQIKGDLQVVVERLTTNSAASDRLQAFLLEQAKRD